MSVKIDMPTNEGTLNLARCVATGAKLVVRGAVPCSGVSNLLGDVSAAAVATWGASVSGAVDISGCAVGGYANNPIPCTSYLPSMVDYEGTDTGKPIAALDIEFTWMPSGQTEYDAIAVLADMYYAFIPFSVGSSYTTGDTVWVLGGNGDYTYYMCTDSVQSSVNPANDSTHWTEVTPEEPTDKIVTPKGVQYRAITDRPVLLYVSVTSNPITVSEELEVDYKVRLYLENVADVDSVTRYIVFDTLGPEFMGSAQIRLLGAFAEQLRHIRDVAVERVNRG